MIVFVNHAQDIKALSNLLNVYEKPRRLKLIGIKKRLFGQGSTFLKVCHQLPLLENGGIKDLRYLSRIK